MTTPLKPFTIEEFIDNEKTPVQHKQGMRAWVVLPPTWRSLDSPVCATFENGSVFCYTANGSTLTGGNQPLLFFSPRKKVVPFDIADIKPGMVFRVIGGNTIHFPYFSEKTAVALGHIGVVTYGDLQSRFEYSTDCVTWNRCEKEVEA